MKTLRLFLTVLTCVAMAVTTCALGEGWTDKEIHFTFEEHVGNVQEQAPQVYAVVQAFMEKYPNVTIDLVGNSEDMHQTKLKLASQSDTLPDLFWATAAIANDLIEKGQLADLSQDLGKDEEWKARFLPNACGAALQGAEGSLHGFSCEMQANCFWINEALFTQCGVELPKTFEDLLAAASVFNQHDIIPLAVGTTDMLGVCWCLTDSIWYYNFGEIYPKIAAGEESWSNSTFLSMFKNWENAAKAQLLPRDAVTLNYYQARELFLNGKAAIFLSGMWDIPQLENCSFAKDVRLWWGPTYGSAPVQEPMQFITAGHPYVVSQRVKETDPDTYQAICEFLRFYYSEEGTHIVVDSKCVPVTKVAAGMADASTNPVLANALQEMATASNTPSGQWYIIMGSAMQTAYVNAILAVLNGVYTAEEACADLDMQMIINSLGQ